MLTRLMSHRKPVAYLDADLVFQQFPTSFVNQERFSLQVRDNYRYVEK